MKLLLALMSFVILAGCGGGGGYYYDTSDSPLQRQIDRQHQRDRELMSPAEYGRHRGWR